MLTFLFIVLMVYLIVRAISNPADKKSAKKLAMIETQTAQLPDISLCANEMSSWQKAANLWPSDKDVLKRVKYTSSTRNIYLEMKDGRHVSCPLSQLDVTFDRINKLNRFVISNGPTFSFYEYAYVFTDAEWDVIIRLLMLAGTTHNIAIMGSAYKNANMIASLIKALNKL